MHTKLLHQQRAECCSNVSVASAKISKNVNILEEIQQEELILGQNRLRHLPTNAGQTASRGTLRALNVPEASKREAAGRRSLAFSIVSAERCRIFAQACQELKNQTKRKKHAQSGAHAGGGSRSSGSASSPTSRLTANKHTGRTNSSICIHGFQMPSPQRVRGRRWKVRSRRRAATPAGHSQRRLLNADRLAEEVAAQLVTGSNESRRLVSTRPSDGPPAPRKMRNALNYPASRRSAARPPQTGYTWSRTPSTAMGEENYYL